MKAVYVAGSLVKLEASDAVLSALKAAQASRAFPPNREGNGNIISYGR
jgi:hypothetical protein